MSFYISNVYSVLRNEFNKTSQQVLIILSHIYCHVLFLSHIMLYPSIFIHYSEIAYGWIVVIRNSVFNGKPQLKEGKQNWLFLSIKKHIPYHLLDAV